MPLLPAASLLLSLNRPVQIVTLDPHDSSGHKRLPLVSSLFILQPRRPRCHFSSRQLQGRLSNLIVSSGLAHKYTHSEDARIHSSKQKTRVRAVGKFTADSPTCTVRSHSCSHTYVRCVLVGRGRWSHKACPQNTEYYCKPTFPHFHDYTSRSMLLTFVHFYRCHYFFLFYSESAGVH